MLDTICWGDLFLDGDVDGVQNLSADSPYVGAYVFLGGHHLRAQCKFGQIWPNLANFC